MNIKNLLSKAINPHSYSENEEFLKTKIATLNTIMLVFSVIILVFGTYRFIQQNYIQAFVDFLLLAAIVAGYILLFRDKYRLKIISRFLIFFALLASLTLIVYLPDFDTRYVWMSICIYMMFFLLDLKEGIIWFLVTMGIIIGLFVSGLIEISFPEFIVFLIATSVFALLLSRYEKIKIDSQRQYMTHSQELIKAVKEKTLEVSAQKDMFESLFQKSYDGLLLFEGDKFIECNEAIVSMLGYSEKEQLLKAHPSQLSPEYQPDGRHSREKADEMIQTCLDNGAHNFEWMHQKADGEDFWCDIALTHLTLGDRELIHVVWRDISELKAIESENKKIKENLEAEVRKRTKELEVAVRAKSEFLANMSHEIRTPLNAMLGFIDILKKDERDEKRREYFDIVNGSGKVLLTIINDILDFSKIESGKLGVEKVPFNIKDLFEQVQLLFYEKAKEKNISLTMQFDSKIPSSGIGDVVRIKQVVSNLLSNAVKFTQQNGEIVIHLSYDFNKSRLSCSIHDNGIGIADENIKSIFKAFSQEDSSTTRKYGGTGLGLAISKNLVELMGGEIGLESQLGKGSVFYFTIACPISQEEILPEVLECKTINGLQKLDGKILIVEDNKMNQLFLQIMLAELGLDSDIAENGKEALEKVKSGSYDLVLMDENMPIMNGIEATKKIRALELNKHLPIIAVTANALKGDKERFLKAGMDDYISKPIDNDIFRKILTDYLIK